MSFLLDNNIISEAIKPRPNYGVVRWLEETDEDGLFLSVATLAEVRRGIERLAHRLVPGARRSRLDLWLRNELPDRFQGRVLPVDAVIRMPGADWRRHGLSSRPDSHHAQCLGFPGCQRRQS